MATETIRKITARTVGVPKGETGHSFVVIGRVNRAVPEQGDFGDYVKLKGSFEAVNESTGEVFHAPVVICPGGLVENEVMTAINNAQESDKGASLDLGVRFKTVKAENPMGLEWRAEMLTEAAPDDPVQRLKAELSAKVPALAAPGSGAGEAKAEGKARK